MKPAARSLSLPYWHIGVAGALVGIAYTLSPMTVLLLPLFVLMARWTGRDLGRQERQWLFGLLTVALAVRLAAIAGLFLTADPDQPFATFFGDEELFKSRAIWLRNIGLGVSISPADFIYAVEETGKTSYLFVLAYLSALVGDMPYGMHVLNTVLYLTGVCVIYRLVRPSYGRLVALAGLAVLLLLPSLFIWSVSALKEPLYTLLAAAELACALQIVRARQWFWRAAAVICVLGIGVLLDGLRKGGLLVAGLGTVSGVLGGLIVSRPRAVLAAVLLFPLVALVAVGRPAVQDRVRSIARDAAIYHVGHVFTPGFSYKTLDSWYYIDPADIRRMPDGDAAKFVVRSMVNYIVQPLPWTIESRSLAAFLPEQVLWLALVALIPVGFVAGLRHDPLLTSVLAAHGFAVMFIVALTSGNLGTLIRHRGLALPYIVWLSMLGAYHLILRVAPAAAVARVRHGGTDHGNR